jgi:hypothetical protein
MDYEVRREPSQSLRKIWCPDIHHDTQHVFSAGHGH